MRSRIFSLQELQSLYELSRPFSLHPLFSGSTPNVNAVGEVTEKLTGGGDKVATYGEIIVEKIHGIGEKLLGHHRSDSDTSTRAKTGKSTVNVYLLTTDCIE